MYQQLLKMGTIQPMNTYTISSFSHSCCYNFKNTTQRPYTKTHGYSRSRIQAMTTVRDGQPEAAPSQEPPSLSFAFVSPVLLPDGTPDVHFRTATGGQKLRDIMLDSNIELYGPYSRPLLNCAGGGTCATCMVEVIEGKELLSPKTDKEKEKLNRNPKNWRLACQTTVGKPDSTGLVVIQQLPEWKGHEWTLGKVPPPES
ncbi:putative 2Fe-2S ferredoxin-type iron-sulfur binding domain, Beta-grasp domain superfamily [Helianthus annuus]|uniref:2Fe-2S ferredoxin-type iron-sulfur binding domain, Beta-grasp domain superfamily n=1 Tax=Helianthus annuus TaxID=4232 RepID=A0A251U0G7_HELAN|nr:photosynthetic NDH subunit of subcomplex B 3, chloroplastic [Helianthus annuus]KAF5793277.1 putative 2Fe-2S ferredoxin-type iron-sulfur binding domain, Beta-grasp domain superfamily [Helianthus annuus]KAJ0528113.1 putative 2Fe-2S ferredoxin-type iron-sulfur binding domain, Beta-grasp domain superfamily [Helianthus annuus]KAJ0544550.1 putative 2Fe-2S ferredoxin-type iron-sulfur binding domain, Beta-grasp domain superfamily [Helianthus annuus]KAJ0895552.1 putative 2Fe-2S ferredoxin-type iron-s